MRRFRISFYADEEPEKVAAEFFVSAEYEDDAIAEATTLFRQQHPEYDPPKYTIHSANA